MCTETDVHVPPQPWFGFTKALTPEAGWVWFSVRLYGINSGGLSPTTRRCFSHRASSRAAVSASSASLSLSRNARFREGSGALLDKAQGDNLQRAWQLDFQTSVEKSLWVPDQQWD